MNAANAETTRLAPRYAVAGLEAGVLGCFPMVGWMMLASLWNHRSIWAIPNLLATTFYGMDAYRDQWLRSTWSGLAMIVAIYGLAGAIWGLIWGERRPPLLWLYGAAAGILVFYAFFHLIWKHANPLIPLYSPDHQIEFAHLLWGMALARSPLYSRRMAELSV